MGKPPPPGSTSRPQDRATARGEDVPKVVPWRKYLRAWQAYNQRRWEFEKDVLPDDERAPFVCECSGGECYRTVQLTMLEFEAAHTGSNWCAVRPGHVMPDDGNQVVMRHPHFWVVEMLALRVATSAG